MHRKLIALAAAVSMVLLVCGAAAASITLFEAPFFNLGSVNGQIGVGPGPWKSAPPGAIPACVPTPTNGQYDQEVVANGGAFPGEPPGWGSQSLRMSNACASGEFFYQTYSPQEPLQVGEARLNKVFMAEFSFMSRTPAYQPGLFLSVSPDSGEGSRMSWVGLEDTEDGIRVTAADTPDVDGEFVAITTWPLLRTVRVHTRSGSGSRSTRALTTTWCESPSTVATSVSASRRGRTTTAPLRSRHRRRTQYARDHQQPAVPLQRAGAPCPPRWWLPVRQREYHSAVTALVHQACDVPIEKTADSPTVTAGSRAGYRITVRNRGRLAARNLRACDRIPRQMTFVSADRRLRRIGRQRCLAIPRLQPGQRVSFHLVLQVNANAPLGRATNTGEVTPPPVTSPTPAGPEKPGAPASPGGPPAVIATPKPIGRVKAVVKIVKRAPAQRGRPAARPPFTG